MEQGRMEQRKMMGYSCCCVCAQVVYSLCLIKEYMDSMGELLHSNVDKEELLLW